MTRRFRERTETERGRDPGVPVPIAADPAPIAADPAPISADPAAATHR